MNRREWLAVAGSAVVAGLGGCGGGTDRTKAHVRLVNATASYSALDLTVGDTKLASSVDYGNTASYADADPSDDNASVSRPGSAAVLASPTVAFAKDSYYTMLAYESTSGLAIAVLDDNTDLPDDNKSIVRILNAAPDAGNVDVYLTGASDALTDSAPLQSAVAYGSVGSFITINSGSWRLRVTAAGSKTDVRLDVSGVGFGSRSVKTLVLTPGRGGVLVNGLVLEQQGGIERADNTQARVRVVAGVAGATVSASVGGSTLMSSAGAPALTQYALLAAGDAAVAASANGVAAALTSATLAGGGDYTLLVYGSAAAPVATLIEDDNGLPTSGNVKLRLVHGIADVTGALTLTVDAAIVASGIAQGTASGYAEVAASTASRFRVTSADGETRLDDDSTSTDRTLVANSVYTFLMVGNASTRSGVLSKDR